MMNKLIVFFCFLIATGCNRKPFVEHKVDFEKVANNCSEQQSYFRMSSNFGGERFEFEKCLAADFKKDQVTSSRQGDTVLVKFPQPAASGNVLYHITLDMTVIPSIIMLPLVRIPIRSLIQRIKLNYYHEQDKELICKEEREGVKYLLYGGVSSPG